VEVEVDKRGASEIEADAGPETRARRTGGALIGDSFIAQMLGKDPLRGKTHLPLLLPYVAVPISRRFRLLASLGCCHFVPPWSVVPMTLHLRGQEADRFAGLAMFLGRPTY
jgi:hypothetical protein